MSVDEFDPEIERLFNRTPALPDAALFTAEVESRLQRGGRVRFAALSLAGVIGGAVALRETMNASASLASAETQGVVAGDAVGSGLRAAVVNAQGVARTSLDQLGLGGLELGSMSGMQLFWIAAGALVALAAAGVMRLSQEV